MLKITKNQGSIQVTADKSGFYPFDGTITFPTNSLFTATSANTDMITFKSTSNGDVQFVGNYKDITISGRSYDTKQKFLTAFSNLANQGSVDAYTKAETDAKLDAKQGKLKAGNGITLTEDATDNTTVVKTAVSLTDNGNGAYTVGDSIEIGGRSSVRIGNNNNVLQGQNSIVIGDHAITNAEKCIAIGNSSEVNVNSTCSIVIGDSAIANGSQNITIGDNRRCDGTKNVGIGCGKLDTVDVNGTGNVCIGENSNVHRKDNTNVDESVAIGKNTRSESSCSVAIGRNAFSKQSYGIAIGSGAGATADDRATNTDSIAIGTFSRADGADSIALGYYSSSKKGGVAIGTSAATTAEKGVAIGEWARATVKDGVAIGELAQTTADSPLVIRAGNKTVDGRKLPITMIQGDANGKISIIKGDGSDERMVIQDEIEALKNAGGGTVDAYTKAETDTKLDAKQDKLTAGSGITIDENNVISSTGGSGGSANPYINVKGVNEGATIADNVTFGIAIGERTNVTKDAGIAIGDQSKAQGRYCVSVGRLSTSIGDSTVAVGDNAKSMMHKAVAIGSSAQAVSKNAVAIGSSANANNKIPLVINAGEDQNSRPLTMIQGDANGKISIPLGDGTTSMMCLQDEIAALKAEIAALKGGA